MKHKILLISAATMVLFSGCAQKASSVPASYVSSSLYENRSCKQLRGDVIELNSRIAVVSGQQDKAATQDAVAMGVGLVLFWPTLFLLAATNDQKAELSHLKGEYNAIKGAAYRKNCRFAKQMK